MKLDDVVFYFWTLCCFFIIDRVRWCLVGAETSYTRRREGIYLIFSKKKMQNMFLSCRSISLLRCRAGTEWGGRNAKIVKFTLFCLQSWLVKVSMGPQLSCWLAQLSRYDSHLHRNLIEKFKCSMCVSKISVWWDAQTKSIERKIWIIIVALSRVFNVWRGASSLRFVAIERKRESPIFFCFFSTLNCATSQDPILSDCISNLSLVIGCAHWRFSLFFTLFLLVIRADAAQQQIQQSVCRARDSLQCEN